MAYVKTDWVDGETVATAERMNNIENGIEANDTNKLNKTSIKTTLTDSDDDTYSCNYLNVRGKTLRVGLTSNQSISATTVTKINYDKLLENNFDDDYENYFKLTDGSIEIMNDNINCVIVVGSVQTNNTGENNIYINKTGVGRYSVAVNSSAGNQAVAIIPVTKGNKIYIQLYANNAGSISNWTDETFFEIVAI